MGRTLIGLRLLGSMVRRGQCASRVIEAML